jgi:cohesin domain-containing protein
MNALHKLLLIGTLCGAVPVFATVISIQPSTKTVGPGQSFTLDVSIASVSDLYGYQFDVGFDPTVLAANSVSEGAFLPGAGATIFFPGTIDNVGGTISFNAGSLTGAVSGAIGSGTLATLSFTSLGSGSSSVGLFNVSAFDSFGEGIALTTSGGTVRISGVPEPSSAVLLAIGFLCLGATISSRFMGISSAARIVRRHN